MVVLFKKGDPQVPKNYRPIAILPVLYKLFSSMLCGRLSKLLMPKHSYEQAAYRHGFSTVVHLLVVRIVAEACFEFNKRSDLLARFSGVNEGIHNLRIFGGAIESLFNR